MIGRTISHYRILEKLGEGGMGEVYLAEDTDLHRKVALKMLPRQMAGSQERLERFRREAQAVAALSHPNIVTVYSIEQSGDQPFITMEVIDGRPLSRVIRSGGIPIAELLRLALPLANALSAAHRHGIVHRDIKPDNVMVTDDGRVKVLDFGLAQLKPALSADSDALTVTRPGGVTVEGSLLGTVAYMSPEQAQGRDVDARSDIFSLGIVLFEMATGERPFKGDNPISLLSAIVKDAAPAVTTLNAALPRELARIVRRCLAKDPARRYQTAQDVCNELEDLPQEADTGRDGGSAPVQARTRTRELLAWTIAGITVAAATIAWFSRARSADPIADVLSILPPDGTTLTEGEAPQVSPDGTAVAFVATDNSGRTLLYVKRQGERTARALDGTDDAAMPFWKPDGSAVGFFANGQLKRADVSGAPPVTLGAAPVPRGGSWSADDTIIFVPFPESKPRSIRAAGGESTELPVWPGELRWMPSFLPGGRRYVYLAVGGGKSGGIQMGSVGSADASPLFAAHTSAAYADGYLVFRREESLVAQRFDIERARLEGTPVLLGDRVAFNPITQQTLASASQQGTVAYLRSGRSWRLTWFDMAGRRLADSGQIGGYNSLCLSAGNRVIYDVADPRTGNVDLWSLDLATGATTRLTFHEAADFYVTCSPSSDEVIFSSPREGTPNPYRMSVASPGSETLIGNWRFPVLPSQWLRDGRLIFSGFSDRTGFDIWTAALPGGQPVQFEATEEAEKAAHVSPDGRWIAYASGKAGADEVYVKPFPDPGSRRWQISKGGGRQPQWSGDGRQLFFISADKKLTIVDVDGSGVQFVAGVPRIFADTRVGGWERTHLGNPYAISPDGKRLLVANEDESPLSVTVLLNWRAVAARK